MNSNWTLLTSPPTTANWVIVRSNSSGSLLGGAIENGSGNNRGVWFSHNSGSTFDSSLNATLSGWSSLAINASGQYIYTSNGSYTLFYSINYGYAWSTVRPINNINAVVLTIAVNSTGAHVVVGLAVGYGISTSSNYGSNWSSSNDAPTAASWSGIASDSTGQYLVACANNTGYGIYTSSNYGSNWTARPSAPTAATWSGIASDSTGQYLVACASDTTYGIYTSSDFGSTWTARTSAPTAAIWKSVSSDSTGQYLVACASNSSSSLLYGIYTSSNYGISWVIQTSYDVSPSLNWTSVASDSTGKFVVASAYQGSIYRGILSYLSSSPSVDLSLLSGSNNINLLANGTNLLENSTNYPTFSNFFNGAYNNTTSDSSTVNSYYYLPFDNTYRLVIQWGYIAAPGTSLASHTYQIPYYNDPSATNPNLMATRWENTVNTGAYSACTIVVSDYDSFIIDTNIGYPANSAAIYWIAIGTAV